MRTPLNDALEELLGHISFHTPGYQPMKNGRPNVSPFCVSEQDFSKGNGIPYRFDVTEMTRTDNLLSPTGVISESHKEISRVYGAERTSYLTAGATSGIFTALSALEGRGTVLVVGNAHRSVYHALRRGRDRVFCCPERYFSMALTGTHAATVVVTSPDYFGKTLNLEKISALCRENHAELVVDAAHGAHFAFSKLLPENAVKYARFVVHSLHKTLPVPTGSALLHYPAEYEDRVAVALSQNHTTSPFYPAMAAMEKAVADFQRTGETRYREICDTVQTFRKEFRYAVQNTNDFTRLVLEFPFPALIAARALEKAGIYPEMTTDNRMVFIVTPYNYMDLEKAAKVLNAVESEEKIERPLPFQDTVRELKFETAWEAVPIKDAVDRISYWEVGAYPPGTPWVVGGERISPETVKRMEEESDTLFGLVNGRIPVVK